MTNIFIDSINVQVTVELKMDLLGKRGSLCARQKSEMREMVSDLMSPAALAQLRGLAALMLGGFTLLLGGLILLERGFLAPL